MASKVHIVLDHRICQSSFHRTQTYRGGHGGYRGNNYNHGADRRFSGPGPGPGPGPSPSPGGFGASEVLRKRAREVIFKTCNGLPTAQNQKRMVEIHPLLVINNHHQIHNSVHKMEPMTKMIILFVLLKIYRFKMRVRNQKKMPPPPKDESDAGKGRQSQIRLQN